MLRLIFNLPEPPNRLISLVLLGLGYGLFSLAAGESKRRLGKLHDLSWAPYYNLGINASPYSFSNEYPDMSSVGAVFSKSGFLGTGTLISPSVVVTAAHLFRNNLASPVPDPSDWQFTLSSPFDEAGQGRIFSVSRIVIHPGWEARLPQLGGQGDGDVLGVDLSIVLLDANVTGVYPAKLPLGGIEPVGEKMVIGGFGNLVDGLNGPEKISNKRRVGGTNVLDRVVEKVENSSVPSEYLGGLLAMDFDSPQLDGNSLGSGEASIDNIPIGDSEPIPLSLESSTAVGDSGGPAFMNISSSWRIVGSVSYGSSDSTYGDVTVYTRLANHLEWMKLYLPPWGQARNLGTGGWLESDWFGFFLPFSSKWNYHVAHGWIYASGLNEESFWSWQSNLGWWWSGASVYPFIYSNERKSWLYFDRIQSTGKKVVFFDFAQGEWILKE